MLASSSTDNIVSLELSKYLYVSMPSLLTNFSWKIILLIVFTLGAIISSNKSISSAIPSSSESKKSSCIFLVSI